MYKCVKTKTLRVLTEDTSGWYLDSVEQYGIRKFDGEFLQWDVLIYFEVVVYFVLWLLVGHLE